MSARFRDYLEKLIAIGELEQVSEEIDLRHVSARIAVSRTALWFTRVRGYNVGVVTGIVGSRARMGAALDCHHRDIGKAFLKRISERKPPVMANSGPVRDVILKGDEVDLTALPVPLISDLDGGPYITSGIGISRDPEYGRNAGAYRLMIRTRRETSVDLVGASDLKLFYDRALRQRRALPFAVAIGTHPPIMLAAAHMAPPGLNEFKLAGAVP